MTDSAPRIPWVLVAALRRLDEHGKSVADVWRELGGLADALGLTRPSYQQTRVLLQREREIERIVGPGEYMLDLLLRTRAPQNAVDLAWEAVLDIRARRREIDAERAWRPGG